MTNIVIKAVLIRLKVYISTLANGLIETPADDEEQFAIANCLRDATEWMCDIAAMQDSANLIKYAQLHKDFHSWLSGDAEVQSDQQLIIEVALTFIGDNYE